MGRSKWSRSIRIICSILVVVLPCCEPTSTVKYLIPDGYTGPVVIVYEESSGSVIRRDEDGSFILEIPSDGVLRVRSSVPSPARVEFFYVGLDGQRKTIPSVAEEDVLQAFDFITRTHEENGKTMNLDSFVVGVPSQRKDWIEVRERATYKETGTTIYPNALTKHWSDENR